MKFSKPIYRFQKVLKGQKGTQKVLKGPNDLNFDFFCCRFTTDESTIEVLAGAHDIAKKENTQQRLKVKKLTVHPDYTGNVLQIKDGDVIPRELNDIALLELSEEIIENEFVKIAKLPERNVNGDNGKSARIAGWGLTEDQGQSTNILQKGDLKIIDVDTCVTEDTYLRRVPYKDTILCASGGNTDSCQVRSILSMFQ